MQRLGFIHDMMDVKVLILYATARSNYPMTSQDIYEVCYQDECLSYFDVCTAVPEMVSTGHLQEVEEGKFQITEKGKDTCSLTEDSIAYTVKQRAEAAVTRYNRQVRRSSYIRTQSVSRENGEHSAVLTFNDDVGHLMTLELTAPDQRQAARLAKLFQQKAETVYNLIMMEMLEDTSTDEG